MTVYRITTEQWSRSLRASGYPARWNAKGRFVIYTAGSRSLAYLENLVHRSGEWQDKIYKVMLIEIPDKIQMDSIEPGTLKKGWEQVSNFSYCQSMAADWLNGATTAVLKVPSAIIKKEYSYLINPQHPEFKLIRLSGTEDFSFDIRF
ncbi:RES family NAD+ phosphorylase [Ferruginibacter paludis]|uniref:RES family NAD+ phosphorylase n=1 Tax=Ferruginibacter paludis TaxID=1310417 RepID=UPI0025B5AC57|nr:RES family NAD+ phosphorylase [Ferruginibacter paludis]MDN3656238.1 RES family NAD+ phosphorylase [Ferruginibacter paludis]